MDGEKHQDALNERILEIVGRYRAGGGYRFDPSSRSPTDPTNPRDPSHDGVTHDLWLGGERVARAADDGATFCCGLTFEVWLEAFRETTGGDPSVAEPAALVADWFCPTMGHPGVAAALVARGLGTAVRPEDARPGDLVQFWRSVDLSRPSGHSAVFLEWLHEPDGSRRMAYWSSQPATGGVGFHSEVVGPAWEVHLVRARAPRS